MTNTISSCPSNSLDVTNNELKPESKDYLGSRTVKPLTVINSII